MCRARSAAPRSRPACSAKMSSDTTRPVTASCARPVSGPLRARCTKGRFRTVSRFENEAVLDRMQDRLAKRPDILDRRREVAEHPFGSIKQWMNQGAFLMRGLENVRGEFSLTALAYNLRRVLNLVGFKDLLAAVAV